MWHEKVGPLVLQAVSLYNGDNPDYKIADKSPIVCWLRKILERGRG